MTIEDRRKKLLYRATYRGFKEADLLIGGFAAANVESFDSPELDEFEALLELDDRQLYNWATQKADPPMHILGPVFNRLMAFKLL